MDNPAAGWTETNKFKTIDGGFISQINQTQTDSGGGETKSVIDITYDDSNQVTSICTSDSPDCEYFQYEQGLLVGIEINGKVFAEFVYNAAGQLVVANLGPILGDWTFQY